MRCRGRLLPPGQGRRTGVEPYPVTPSLVEQTAIHIGNMLVIVSGSPGLVDTNLAKAISKWLSSYRF